MAKPYGKNIDLHKKFNKRLPNSRRSPKDLLFISKTNTGTTKNTRYYTPYKFQLPRGGDSTTQYATNNNRNPAYNSSFYLWLLDNAICQIKHGITPGAATSIAIANPDLKLGANYLLRKGDYFWIYNRRSFKSMRLQCDGDVLDTATSITIVSTTFKIQDRLPAGSIIVPDFQIMTERVSNTPQLKRFDLTNTEYKNLQSSPYTLLAAEAGKIHIPLSATLIINYTSDEMTPTALYIGHNGSTTIGEYWASLDRAFWRSRNSQMVQLTPFTQGTGTFDNDTKPIISKNNNTSGLPLRLYATSNYTNTSNTLTILLYYKTIVL